MHNEFDEPPRGTPQRIAKSLANVDMIANSVARTALDSASLSKRATVRSLNERLGLLRGELIALRASLIAFDKRLAKVLDQDD